MQNVKISLIGSEKLFSYFRTLLKDHYTFINTNEKIKEIEQQLYKEKPNFILMQVHAQSQPQEIDDAKRIMLDLGVPVFFLHVSFDGEDVDYITLSYPDITIIKPVTTENLKKSLDLSLENFKKIISTNNESERLKYIKEHLKNELKKHANSYRQIIPINPHCIYNTQEKALYYHERKITFSKKESRLLELLVKQLDNPVTYEMIDAVAWEGEGVLHSTIRSLVRRIRDKTYSDFITNIPGIGYKIESHQNAHY